MVPLFKNVVDRSTVKRYQPVSLLFVVNKVFEKLLNNKIVDHLEKFALFFDFEYGFRSCRSTSDLLTVVSDRTSRAFNRSGATGAAALDRVWYAGLLHKLMPGLNFWSDISLLFLLFSVIDSFEWFWLASLHKNIQLMLEILKVSFLVPHFSCYTLMIFLMMLSVTLLSMLMILLSILSVICGNNLNWLLVRGGLLISMLENSTGFT